MTDQTNVIPGTCRLCGVWVDDVLKHERSCGYTPSLPQPGLHFDLGSVPITVSTAPIHVVWLVEQDDGFLTPLSTGIKHIPAQPHLGTHIKLDGQWWLVSDVWWNYDMGDNAVVCIQLELSEYSKKKV